MIHELPHADDSRVISAKIRQKSELLATSKRTGPALSPSSFSTFMEKFTDAPGEIQLRPFDPSDLLDFPDLLLRAISSSKKNRSPGRDMVTS